MPSRLGQRFTAALRTDSTVTRREAEELVSQAKAERKLTPAMHLELSALLQRNSAKLDPQARAVLDEFLASARPRTDLPDPAVLKTDRTSVTWAPVGPDSTLYIDGVHADDVLQGEIGDCYLASAMSSMAAADPDLIRNAITDNGDGTYTVRFYQGVGDRRRKAVLVTVDDDMATDDLGGARYASARDGDELWPSLLEKAYAKWKGGYERIGNGGSASDLFEAVCGRTSTWGEVKDYRPDLLFKKIQTVTAGRRPVSAGTFADNGPVQYNSTGLYGDHFYTVLGAVEENGTRYIQLRNPWGESEPAGDGQDDGTFKLPLADFMKLYENIEFGG